jgi:hypothetical protein
MVPLGWAYASIWADHFLKVSSKYGPSLGNLKGKYGTSEILQV